MYRISKSSLSGGLEKGEGCWTNVLCIRISRYKTGRFALRITRERHLRKPVDVFPNEQLKARIRSVIYIKSRCVLIDPRSRNAWIAATEVDRPDGVGNAGYPAESLSFPTLAANERALFGASRVCSNG